MGGAALAVAIIELVLKYGVPGAVSIYSTWHDGLEGREPTKEDFEALRAKVRDPEDYFKEAELAAKLKLTVHE